MTESNTVANIPQGSIKRNNKIYIPYKNEDKIIPPNSIYYNNKI